MEKDPVETLKSLIKALVVQEVRRRRLERIYSPSFVLEAMNRSIHEAKGNIRVLLDGTPAPQTDLVKSMIRDSVDEEIDILIDTRRNRCLRCLHMRYYDEAGTAYTRLPCPTGDTACEASRLMIGCRCPPDHGKECGEFVENRSTPSLDDYVYEMTYFYEIREKIDFFDDILEYLKEEG